MFSISQPNVARRLGCVALLGLGVALSSTTAYAGFFDQLFGGIAEPAPRPSYGYEQQQPLSPEFGVPLNAPPLKKRMVVKETPPVRQKTTDLWHDKTLHPGDAVMMKGGLQIYSGAEASKHTAKQFVPIDHARMSSKARSALMAMDTTRNDPLKSGAAPDTLASGRSAAVGAPISKGFRITDARGQSVRYVGP